MDKHGKSPTRNKRRNRSNKKKNQDPNAAGRNEQNTKTEVQGGRQGDAGPTQNAKCAELQQQKDKQQINSGQPTQLDKDKAKKQGEKSEPVPLKKGNLDLQNETQKSQHLLELQQRARHQMDEMEKLLVKCLQEENKTQKVFDLRTVLSGQDEKSCEERARKIEMVIQTLKERKKLSGKSAPQPTQGDQESRLLNIYSRYDELKQVLKTIKALENEAKNEEATEIHHVGTTVTTKDAKVTTISAKGENKKECTSNDKEDTKKENGQNDNLSGSSNPKRIEKPLPTSKQNFPAKVNNSSEKCLGASYPGVVNFGKEIGDGIVDGNAPLRSSPIDEDQRSESSHQQLSSDDSNESLAFQAFASPMKFLRRVKKKVGNFLFSTKKEKAKDSDYDGVSNASCDNIDIEARAGTSRDVSTPCLSQPVQRAFLEFQNDAVHGKARNRRGLEQILVTPESPAVLCTKTTMLRGQETKETERCRQTGLVTQGTGPKQVKNATMDNNVAHENVPKKEASPGLKTPQPNKNESANGKFAAHLNQTGTRGSPQREIAKRNETQPVAANEKAVPVVLQNGAHVDKQKSDLEKRATSSKGPSPLPTTPQQNMTQTPSVNAPGNANHLTVNNGSNSKLKVSSKSDADKRINVPVQHQKIIASSTQKNLPVKTTISTKTVGVSPSKSALVASGAKVQSKDQTNLQQQPMPQKEQRKDAILKRPTQGVDTKSTISEEKKKNSPGPGKLQERNKDPVAQVVVSIKTSPAPSPHQQEAAKKDDGIRNKQENCAGGSESTTGLTKKEQTNPTSKMAVNNAVHKDRSINPSKVPHIAASLPPGKKASPVTNQTNVPVKKVKSSNSEKDSNQDNMRQSSPYVRRILKARRRIVFEENNNQETTGSDALSDTGEVDYETVMPEEFERAIAEAMDDESFTEQTAAKEKPTNRHLQDIPESSALEIITDVKETPPHIPPGRKKKNRGKYATGFSNLRKSINCCCEFVCDYCVPSWEWDKVVANQRKKR